VGCRRETATNEGLCAACIRDFRRISRDLAELAIALRDASHAEINGEPEFGRPEDQSSRF